VQDIERARKFYETVFQIRLEKLGGPEMERESHLLTTMLGYC
jgi:predicted enzyme related to lactoylglutathione lyase